MKRAVLMVSKIPERCVAHTKPVKESVGAFPNSSHMLTYPVCVLPLPHLIRLQVLQLHERSSNDGERKVGVHGRWVGSVKTREKQVEGRGRVSKL